MFILWLDLCCHTYLKNIFVSLVTFAREFAMWCSSSQSSTWKNLNMSLFVIYLLLNLLYLTFVCDQEINEFYLFICVWPGVDDFLTKTGHRVCQCYMFNFCIFELLWIQMVKETGKTQTNYLQFLLEISPVVSQIGNSGVFKAHNIIADCLAFLGLSVWWPHVSTTLACWKYFWRWLWNRFVEPAQKRLRLHEMSQGRVRGSRLFLQYSFLPFLTHSKDVHCIHD